MCFDTIMIFDIFMLFFFELNFKVKKSYKSQQHIRNENKKLGLDIWSSREMASHPLADSQSTIHILH
jgi:hypothetical protein